MQSEVEGKVRFIFERFRDNSIGEKVPFLRDKHIAYLKSGIRYVHLDSMKYACTSCWI